MPANRYVWMAAAAVVLMLAGLGAVEMSRRSWSRMDFNTRAIDVIAGELPPGSRGSLSARTLAGRADAADRFVCVFSPAAIYQVQFRKGLFRTAVNEIYSPKWQPGHSGAIVRQDCASSGSG